MPGQSPARREASDEQYDCAALARLLLRGVLKSTQYKLFNNFPTPLRRKSLEKNYILNRKFVKFSGIF